ncbi:hypothetical protein J7E55_11910 [Bacillus sp. ISL-53]|nr:hypothetical protein [Bacillus sp. ISL-53]
MPNIKDTIKEVFSKKKTIEYNPEMHEKCDDCNGSGLDIWGSCVSCDGQGFVEMTLK